MILDAATLLNYFDPRSDQHWSVAGEIELLAESEPLVVSPFVIAELESTIRGAFGLEGLCAALEELASGAWTIAPVDADHLVALRRGIEGGATMSTASVEILSHEGAS